MQNRESSNIDLSIIIVTWNSEEDLPECLNSILDNNYNFKFEVIIVDNNSSDNSAKVINNFIEIYDSDIKLIINKVNVGFTKACNQGIKISKGNYILFLNPDTEIVENSLDFLYKKFIMENSFAAIVPQLLNVDGTIQYSCRKLPRYIDLYFEIFLLSSIFSTSTFFSRWKMKYFSHDEETEVEQPMAAAFLLKKSILDVINNFDESYYMFFNDVDLCKKISDKNMKILFYPEAKIIHKKGISINKDHAKMIKAWNSDCLKYFKKYHYNFVKFHVLKILFTIIYPIRILIKS